MYLWEGDEHDVSPGKPLFTWREAAVWLGTKLTILGQPKQERVPKMHSRDGAR